MSHYFTNDNLVSEIKKVNVKFMDTSFTFNTDNGVFSKGELDFGTYLLLKNTASLVYGDVLDLGCGYGAIGIILNKIASAHVTMVDVNRRAVHLSAMNIKENGCLNAKCLVSDGISEIKDEKFDFVVTNPPIRVGKQKLYELILDSKKCLKENGEIYLVIRKQQGANSFIKDMQKSFDVNIVDKDKGFLIICLK